MPLRQSIVELLNKSGCYKYAARLKITNQFRTILDFPFHDERPLL